MNSPKFTQLTVKRLSRKNFHLSRKLPLNSQKKNSDQQAMEIFKSGADLGFSRGGGGFSKKIENFDDLFFLGRPN